MSHKDLELAARYLLGALIGAQLELERARSVIERRRFVLDAHLVGVVHAESRVVRSLRAVERLRREVRGLVSRPPAEAAGRQAAGPEFRKGQKQCVRVWEHPARLVWTDAHGRVRRACL